MRLLYSLKFFFYHKGCTDTQSCDCGHIIEVSKHFVPILICPPYNNPRRDMLNEVQMHSQTRITPQLLLNCNHCLTERESMHIIRGRPWMSTFSWVYKPYTFGGGSGGVCENQHFFCTLLTFWPDFYYFHRDCWHSKSVDVYSFFEVGGGFRKRMDCTLMKMLTFMDGPLLLCVNS